MSLSKEHQDFLKAMGIESERFEKLGRDAQTLIDIANDYKTHQETLQIDATSIASKLQLCKGVHSVRFRVKETSHLVEKIIRKWEKKSVDKKYDMISKDNYKSTVDDLIGVRAIHLFKKDGMTVHDYIVSKWKPKEKIIYYRQGDDLTQYATYEKCKKVVHPNGYRSIHYIVPVTKINGEQVHCEIQTRTIFEEGWSEIDHQVRYPSFSDNPYLQEFLDIFNRICGSADEMGSFVNSLRELIQLNDLLEENKKLTIQTHETRIHELENKIEQLFKDKAELQEIEAAYNSLKDAKAQKDQIEQKAAFKTSNSEVSNQYKAIASFLGVNPQALSSFLGADPRKVLESALGKENMKAMESALGGTYRRAAESALLLENTKKGKR